LGDQIKKVRIVTARGKNGNKIKAHIILVENLKERDHPQNPRVDDKKILNSIF
jgi:hypothetical protein